MNLPAKTHGADLSAYARTIAIAKCRCGRTPAIGVIRDPFEMRVIEAIEVRCGCGAWMQEAIDFDESYAKDYPSAAEKVRAALYHWAMAVKYNLPLNQPANIDRLIRIAEKYSLPENQVQIQPGRAERVDYLPPTTSL